MVRNEADIVEAFVRHNLSILDGMAIIDHGSVDGTLPILRRLAAEPLPLVLFENDTPAFRQEQITTVAVRRVLAQFNADFVFTLDADEFLKIPARAGLDRALLAIPPRMHGVLRWLTYVPRFDPAPRDLIELLRGSRRIAVERHIFHKVVVSRHLLATPDAMLSNGNHYVAPRPNAPSEESGPHARVRDAFAAIAHVPIRSGAQLIAKVAVKKLGRMAASMDWAPDAGSQYAYETVRSGRELDAATLLENAVNWSVVRNKWLPASSVELVDDPFLASIALKYTPPAAADPLPLVLAAIERIVRRLAPGVPAPSPRAIQAPTAAEGGTGMLAR